MQIGQKGTKYGLQVRGPARPAAKQPAVKPVAAAFAGGSDSDEEENVGTQVARQAMRKQSDAKVQEMYAAALAQDPTAFDYDGVYDALHATKAAPRHAERIERRSRYIAGLVEQAEVRKKEADIAFERKLLKDLQKEDGQYADEEKFVTAAYRRKLEEDKQWVAAQKMREAQEEAEDVRKKGNLNDFYANLLHKNVAFGASGPQQPQQQQEELEDAGELPSSSRAAAVGGGRGGEEGSDGEEEEGAGPGPASRAAAAAAAGRSASPDRQQRRQQQQRLEDGSGVNPRDGAAATAPSSTGRAPTEADSEPPGGGREGAAAVGAKRKADDAAVAAARERYLARRKQQAAGGS